jgi:hypothetical protein
MLMILAVSASRGSRQRNGPGDLTVTQRSRYLLRAGVLVAYGDSKTPRPMPELAVLRSLLPPDVQKGMDML